MNAILTFSKSKQCEFFSFHRLFWILFPVWTHQSQNQKQKIKYADTPFISTEKKIEAILCEESFPSEAIRHLMVPP